MTRVFGRERRTRGQMVLLAGVVVALALVAMLVAYLQLGYHADVTTSGIEEDAIRDDASLLQRATHDTARSLRGEYVWDQRREAVAAFRDGMEPRLRVLERSQVESGVVSEVSFNQTVAQRWAAVDCPDGTGREFGPCETDRGVVVQKRGDRMLVLAVGYDLTVTTEDRTANLTLLVETVSG